MDLESIHNMILACGTSSSELEILHKNLNAAAGILAAVPPDALYTTLTALDPNTHALGLLHILVALGSHVTASTMDGEQWMDAIAGVANSMGAVGSTSWRMVAGVMVRQLALSVFGWAQTASKMKRAVGVLTALGSAAAGGSDGELVPAHALAVRAAVLGKMHAMGLRVYEELAIERVDNARSGVLPEDMLAYYYFAAHCAIGMRKYDTALEALVLLFSVPAEAVSAIAVEGYKLYALVSLLVHGKILPVPRYVLSAFKQHVKVFCHEYVVVGDAFESGSAAALDEALAAGAEVFQADHTWGLAKRTRKALIHARIARLTQTYITVSLDAIAESAGLASASAAHDHVVDMIDAGVVHATINDRTGMVQFLSNPETFDNAATLRKLNTTIVSCAQLAERVRDLDAAFLLNPDYIMKTELAHKTRAGDIDDMFALSSAVGESVLASASGPHGGRHGMGGDDPY